MTHARATGPISPEASFLPAPDHPSPQQLRDIALDAADDVGPALAASFRTSMEVQEKTSTHDLVTRHDSATEDRLMELLGTAVPDSHITGEEGGTRGAGTVEWIVDPIDGTSNFAHGFAMFSVSIAAAVDGEVLAGVVHDPVNDLTFSADDDGAWLRQGTSERRLDGRAQRALHASGGGTDEARLNLVTSYPSAEVLQIEGPAALEAFGEVVSTFATVRRVVSGALELCHAAAGWADVVFGVDTQPWDVAAGMLILRRAGGTYRGLGHAERFAADAAGDAAGAAGDGGVAGDGGRAGDHLAPHYLAFAPGVDSPTATRLVEAIAARRAK